MKTFRVALLFTALLAFWMMLSGRLDWLFFWLGVGSAALVTALSTRLMEGVIGSATDTPRIDLLRLLAYIGWLAARLPSAGLQVARVVVDPRVPPRPGVVHFRTRLASPAARALLANSITVIPGTMTIDVEGDTFIVHAFTPWEFEDLATAAMQRRIEGVFRQELDEPPELYWERTNNWIATPAMIRAVREGRRDVLVRPADAEGDPNAVGATSPGTGDASPAAGEVSRRADDPSPGADDVEGGR
jgi:multicomponent Na+:H+ antiporter subunit E